MIKLYPSIRELQLLVWQESHRVPALRRINLDQFLTTEAPQIKRSISELRGRITTLSSSSAQNRRIQEVWQKFENDIDKHRNTQIQGTALILNADLARLSKETESNEPHVLHCYQLDPFILESRYGSDLVVVRDDYSKPLQPNEILESDYQSILELYKRIESNQTNLKIEGDEKFRSKFLSSIQKIMTRELGRELLIEITKYPPSKQPIHIKESEESEASFLLYTKSGLQEGYSNSAVFYRDGNYYIRAENGAEEKAYKKISVSLGKSADEMYECQENGFIKHKITENWMTLFHEFCHVVHFLNGAIRTIPEKIGLLKSPYNTDPEEELTILGVHNTTEDRFNENSLRKAFNMTPRIYHYGYSPGLSMENRLDWAIELNAVGDLVDLFLNDRRADPYQRIGARSLLSVALEREKCSRELIELLLYFDCSDVKNLPSHIDALLRESITKEEVEKLISLKTLFASDIRFSIRSYIGSEKISDANKMALLDALIENHVDLSRESDLLKWAISNGKLEIAEKLIALNAGKDRKSHAEHRFGYTYSASSPLSYLLNLHHLDRSSRNHLSNLMVSKGYSR